MTQKQKRLAYFGGIFFLLIAAMFLSRFAGNAPPPVTDSSYHEGEWVNKKGDLVDTRTGKVLKKHYLPVPSPNQVKVE